RAARGVRLDRLDRGRGGRGLGGAGHPPRRGARRGEGGSLGHGRRGGGGGVRAAVAEVPDDASVIVVHDAARLLVSDEIVERVLKPLGEGFHGAVPALPVADTIKRVQGGEVVETVDRGN